MVAVQGDAIVTPPPGRRSLRTGRVEGRAPRPQSSWSWRSPGPSLRLTPLTENELRTSAARSRPGNSPTTPPSATPGTTRSHLGTPERCGPDPADCTTSVDDPGSPPPSPPMNSSWGGLDDLGSGGEPCEQVMRSQPEKHEDDDGGRRLDCQPSRRTGRDAISHDDMTFLAEALKRPRISEWSLRSPRGLREPR